MEPDRFCSLPLKLSCSEWARHESYFWDWSCTFLWNTEDEELITALSITMLLSLSFNISYMEELCISLALLHSCFLGVFLLPANLLHDLGQNVSPKWLHLLRNDEASLLTQGVYNETSRKLYYQEFSAIGEGYLYDQQYPWKRVEILSLLVKENRN